MNEIEDENYFLFNCNISLIYKFLNYGRSDLFILGRSAPSITPTARCFCWLQIRQTLYEMKDENDLFCNCSVHAGCVFDFEKSGRSGMFILRRYIDTNSRIQRIL